MTIGFTVVCVSLRIFFSSISLSMPIFGGREKHNRKETKETLITR